MRVLLAATSKGGDGIKRLHHVRSYVMKDGRLFLSMAANGGVFEFEPGP